MIDTFDQEKSAPHGLVRWVKWTKSSNIWRAPEMISLASQVKIVDIKHVLVGEKRIL